MIVLVFEEKDRLELMDRLGPQSYPSREPEIAHYEMSNFFKIEGFTTIEQVENWWEDK